MADPQKQPVDVTPPIEVKDKADLAAVRMMEREKAEREKTDRERIMTTATMDAAAARTAMASKEAPQTESTDRTKTGAAVAGAAMATGAAATRTEPTPITPERPVTGTVVPPGTERATPLTPYGTVDERARMHAEDPSVHPDWESQPQINAPRDVGVPTPEGQVDARRIQEGRRRSDEAREPRIERRGSEVSIPLASGANPDPVKSVKEETHKVTAATKETARDVKEDVERKI